MVACVLAAVGLAAFGMAKLDRNAARVLFVRVGRVAAYADRVLAQVGGVPWRDLGRSAGEQARKGAAPKCGACVAMAAQVDVTVDTVRAINSSMAGVQGILDNDVDLPGIMMDLDVSP